MTTRTCRQGFLNGLRKASRHVALLLALSVLLFGSPAAAQSTGQPIGALGKIQPLGGYVEILGAPGDKVREVLVQPGSRVKVGAVLARLSSDWELERAAQSMRLERDRLRDLDRLRERELELKVSAADLTVKLAEGELESYRQIGSSGRTARKLQRHENQLEQAQLERAAAATALELQRRSMVHNLLIAELKLTSAEERLAENAVSAPRGGVVLEVMAIPGGRSGGRLFTLGDLSAIEVVSDVFEADLARVRIGAAATVTASAFKGPLRGKVIHIGRRIDAKAKVGKVWVKLETAEPANRYLGMEVNVEIVP